MSHLSQDGTNSARSVNLGPRSDNEAGTDVSGSPEEARIPSTVTVDKSIFKVDIGGRYYARLDSRITLSDPRAFSEYVKLHKEKIEATTFLKPSAEVFQGELSRIAINMIVDQNTRLFKTPAQISDLDMQKLEVLRTEYNFDYWKEVKVGYTSWHDYRGVEAYSRSDATHQKQLKQEYQVPMVVYLADSETDFTPIQARLVGELLDRQSGNNELVSEYGYATHTPGSQRHLEKRNIFHAIIEGGNIAECPNKSLVAERLLREFELGSSLYDRFAARSEWNAPESRNFNASNFYMSEGAYHGAVRSGHIENVDFLRDHGVNVTSSGSGGGYGGNPFALAAKRMSVAPESHAIAERILEIASEQSSAPTIAKGSYRTSKNTLYPIECFAQDGDLDIVAILAGYDAGVPIIEAHEIRDTVDITLGGYWSDRAGAYCEGWGSGDFNYHPTVYTKKRFPRFFLQRKGEKRSHL